MGQGLGHDIHTSYTTASSFPSTPRSGVSPEADGEEEGSEDLAGLVCSSMASTALSTELSSDWVWLAVSFSRKRVTNWSTLLPLS